MASQIVLDFLLGVLKYLVSAEFWAATTFAILTAVFYGFMTTGIQEGPTRHQMNVSGEGSRFRVLFVWLVAEIVYNGVLNLLVLVVTAFMP